MFAILKGAVINGDRQKTTEITETLINQGSKAMEIFQNGLIPAMDIVGKKMKNNEFFIPEVLISARAMQGAMEILRPLIVESGIKPIGKVVIGTVKGDLHDIGKNLVIMLLEGAGFQVIDLGIDVSAENFIKKIVEEEADILALSAMLSTTMQQMKVVIQTLEQASLRSKVKVMIGGAPLTKSYAEMISADGYATDANEAVLLARQFIQANSMIKELGA